MDDEEKLLYGLFLNSGVRDAEMQNTEYADFNWEKCTLHVQPKAVAQFPSQGQEEKEVRQGQIHSDSGEAGLENQGQNERAATLSRMIWCFRTARANLTDTFLRKLKAIAKKASVEGAELHRFRKTYADTLHEEGVSVNTIRIRLGHESLDVTLAYLKGKDAESEEAQEHANSSSLALYAKAKDIHYGRFPGLNPGSPVRVL